MASFRYAVSVMPKEGILDPQGRAVELSLPHLHVAGVHAVRVGRRVELTVDASDEASARDTVEGLAGELFANPLIESWTVELVAAASSTAGAGAAAGVAPGAR
jgi:phosphoribosylformylglycinamidine synthase